MYENEREFEAYIRKLIATEITATHPHIYALTNKKAVDILICKEGATPELFFIEVKFHQSTHGRCGFGSRQGGGFQPEIVSRRPAYFEQNLRWVLACNYSERGKLLFVNSEHVRRYLANGQMGQKFNNFQKKIFVDGPWLSEQDFVKEMRRWLGV